MRTQTDNGALDAKLALRRAALARWPDDPRVVFDVCQGAGTLWGALRGEFQIARYFGADIKPSPGRLRVDSARLLAAGDLGANIIDVDTYGEPWKHWRALLPHIARPTTVFLTLGQANYSVMRASADSVRVLGLGGLRSCPLSLAGRVARRLGCRYALAEAHQFVLLSGGFQIVTARGTRYIAVRVEPKTRAGPAVHATGPASG